MRNSLVFNFLALVIILLLSACTPKIDSDQPTNTPTLAQTPEDMATSFSTATSLSPASTSTAIFLSPTPTGELVNSINTPSGTPCAPPPSNWVAYIIQPGDSLSMIASNYVGLTTEFLQITNCLSSPDEIRAGDVLFVPPPRIVAAQIPTTAPIIFTSTPRPANMLKEIFFDTGGEPQALDCPPWQGVDRDIKLSVRVKDFFALCFYRFTLHEEIKVQLSPKQDVSFVVSNEFTVTEKDIFKVFLWAPVGLAPDWTVSVGGRRMDITFSPFDVRATNTLPDVKINPFEFKGCENYSFKLGEVLVVKGTRFDPNIDVSVGLYWESTGDKYPFVRGQIAETDDSGNFATTFTILPTDPSGKLWVISTTNSIKGSQDDPYREADQDVQCFQIVKN